MSLGWTNDQTFQFIELYRKEGAIWNPKCKDYKDRNRINDAWERISDAMCISVQELKRKKETLMTAFRTHYKKKLSTLKTGEDDIHKPIWIYYDALEVFLKDIYENQVEIKKEDSIGIIQSCKKPILASYARKRKATPPSAIPAQVQERLQSPPPATYLDNESEFLIMAKGYAAKLQKLTKEQLIFADRIITEALVDAQLAKLTRWSYVVNSPDPITLHEWSNSTTADDSD